MVDLRSRADFAGHTVLVCGVGLAGLSATRALLALGAVPVVTADRDGSAPAELPAGVDYRPRLLQVPAGIAAVVASPGLPPTHPLLVDAGRRGLPVLGEVEFAWRIRGERPADWLLVTGTNGKTTTARMLLAMLVAAGLDAQAVGNIGVSLIDAVLAEHQVLVVEASSFQLHFSDTVAPRAGVLLNLAEDHLDWHGSMADYAAAKTKVWTGELAVGNADDPAVTALLAHAPAARRTTFTLGVPAPGQFGVRDGRLVDDHGVILLPAAEVRPAGGHNVANALAAAALAAAVGADAAAIAAGLRAFVPDPHRNQRIGAVRGVEYIDDSKATNPHAAAASLGSYRRIVWIAGGQLKGAAVDELVAEHADRLAGAVLLGVDRAEIKIALTRHAPDLPVIEVSRTDHGAMQDVVAAAASLAAAGDVVLLAPAAASKDMFSSYEARGTAFSTAVTALARPGERV